jgi:hypothetical protein
MVRSGTILGFHNTDNVESSTILMTLIDMNWCIFIEILKWTCTKQWGCSYRLRHEGQILDNFKKFLSIKVIKIVLDSTLSDLQNQVWYKVLLANHYV